MQMPIADIIHLRVIPLKYSLSENYPNPFNPTTTISYTLPAASNVSIRVYNVIGQLVDILVDSRQSAGYHSVVFDASDLSSGVYFDAINAISDDGTQQYSTVKIVFFVNNLPP